ncbi:MAG: RNA 2',3'-cyclic phosphodiesterase [Steroidobacteraceae bacterium]
MPTAPTVPSPSGTPTAPGPSAAPEGARRLFFALWPSAAMQRELEAAARIPPDSMRGGRQVAAESLHLTLAFLGSVPEASLEAVKECARIASRASRIAPPALGVTLDTIEYWPRSQLLCATPGREPAGAAEFAEDLQRGLCDAGFTPDRTPFRAHVTLARRVRRRPAGEPPVLEMPQVRWTCADFALVDSRTGPGGSAYSVLESWLLCRS